MQPAVQIHDFQHYVYYQHYVYIYFGFVSVSKKLKRDNFFEADSQCKFKRLLKADLAYNIRSRSFLRSNNESNALKAFWFLAPP